MIHGGEKLVHGLLGFVAHIRDTEGSPFDLAIAAINEEPGLFYQLLQFGHIYDPATGFGAIVNASQRD